MLRRFKEATADLHVEAERYVRILDADASLEDYRRYLRTMHAFHAPLEARFRASAGLRARGFDPDARQRAPLAAADLAALDSAPGAACTALPDAHDDADLLGIAYVLEGSTLGGRFILAKLPAALQAVHPRATAFLVGYGSETGARWRAFGAIVERALVAGDDADRAVAAARMTFARLVDWLATHERRAWKEAS